MKILFLSRWFPYPADNGSKLRITALLQALAGRHTVDLLAFTHDPPAAENLRAAQAVCRRVQTAPFSDFQPRRWRARLAFLSIQPRSVVDTHSPEMARLVAQAAQQEAYDVVVASELGSAPYALTVPAARVLEDVEVLPTYEPYARQAGWRRWRAGLTWWKTARYVAGLLRGFDACTVVSGPEQVRVQGLAPAGRPVVVVPNGVDVTRHAGDFGPVEADSLVYSGALTYHANFDAVAYFLREIFPLLRAERPAAHLYVTGWAPHALVERLPAVSGVEFTGYLDDVRPRVARSWASVVPLRQGGGTRLKILESLALGTPVIATPKGAEGLDLVPEQDYLVAETPAEFAAQTARLLASAGLRAALAAQGQRVAATRYDWSRIGQDFVHLVETAGRRRRAGQAPGVQSP